MGLYVTSKKENQKQNRTKYVCGDFVTTRIRITLFFNIDRHLALHQHTNRRKYKF